MAVAVTAATSRRKPPEVRTVSEQSLENAFSDEELANRSIVEHFEQTLEDRSIANSAEVSTIPTALVKEAKKLKAETGRATYRRIAYTEGELDASCLSAPPSPSNPHPFDAATLPPVHSHSLVPFVNHSPLLRFLVDIGTDLSEIENTTSIGHHLLRLDIENVRRKIDLLTEQIGFADSSSIGRYLTRNPFFLLQDVQDMQTRLNYLEMKKFTKAERLKIVDGYRYWLNCNVALIDARLGWIQKTFRLTAKATRDVIVKEPRIAMFGTGPLERLYNLFAKELNFSQEQLKAMVAADPRLFMMDAQLVAKTYRYVRDVMRINNATIAEHPFLLRCSLSSIRLRHEFLLRLGRANYQLVGSKSSGKKDLSEIVDGTTTSPSSTSSEELVSLEHFMAASDADFACHAAKTYPVAFDRFLRNS